MALLLTRKPHKTQYIHPGKFYIKIPLLLHQEKPGESKELQMRDWMRKQDLPSGTNKQIVQQFRTRLNHAVRNELQQNGRKRAARLGPHRDLFYEFYDPSTLTSHFQNKVENDLEIFLNAATFLLHVNSFMVWSSWKQCIWSKLKISASYQQLKESGSSEAYFSTMH